MKRILFSLFIICGVVKLSTAQTEELFTYGNNKANLDEFARQFYKNNPEQAITRDTAKYYLGLFINFKLKVQEAKDLGMDTAEDFVSEMAQYKKQLAQPYMVDTSATEMLIQEAYSHLQQEVRASHIMVAIGYDALPKDTIAAWNRAMALKNKLKSVPFDTLAKDSSDDQSAKDNFGDLGYFTAFDMIYPFEEAAYNTKVGEIAGPLRTQFGYHIIKVWDKRPAYPKMEVSHIMLNLPQGANDEEIKRVKQKIDSIAAEIKTGKNTFENLALEYSEDANTRSQAGKIGFIESTNRNIPQAIRNAAFALKNNGDISQPVKSPFGWHILKRTNIEPLKPLDSLYNDIKRKVTNPRDERYKLTHIAVIERIKKEYNFVENTEVLNNFISTVADSTILKGSWKAAEHSNATGTLFTLGNKQFTQKDFANFIEKNQQPLPNGDIGMTTRNLYNSFVDQNTWNYEEDNLGSKYDKYRFLVQEYNDGILLFNLSEKKVWNKGITDTTGLKEYYEQNKTRFMWQDRIAATIYECKTEDIAKNVKKWVKKKYADTAISRKAYEINPLSLAIKTGKFQHGDHIVTELVKWKKGKYMVEKDGKYYYVVITKVIPAEPKALAEVRGPITSEYQTMLEKKWIDELKQKYPVTVNQDTFTKFLNSLPR
jgi:peptidyl-prolyl cis-trans isomerase SurA